MRPQIDWQGIARANMLYKETQNRIAQQNANTTENLAGTEANLNRTRNELLPGESAASVAESVSRRNLNAENTKYVGPLAKASIRSSDAGVRNTDMSTRDIAMGLKLFNPPEESYFERSRAMADRLTRGIGRSR